MNTTTLPNPSPFARIAALVCAAFLLLNPFTRASAAGRLPAIYAFNVAAEATINLGTTTSLSWQVGDATSVTLAPLGDVTGKTEIDISPTVTTTYVLTATNSAGSVSKSKKITVIVPPVFQSLTATPDSINAGGASTLKWSAPGASYFSVIADTDGDLGNVFGNSLVVKPATTTTYSIRAVNTAGFDLRTITIPVAAPVPKPTISSFTAAPISVVVGGATTLRWAVNGATSLAISPGVGAVTGTSVDVNPTATTTYTLTATNSSGSVTKKTSVTVTTAAPAPVINSFTATPGAITAGAPSTLAWSATGATSFTITADVGASPGLVNGNSLVVHPTVTTTYTLAAINTTGSVTKIVSITVTPSAPMINLFTATPGTILKGDSTALAWSVDGATSLSISPAIGAVTGTSITIKPPATVNYVLTATNAGGSVTKNVLVTVNQPVPLPVIDTFTALPDAITTGNSSTLSWSVNGATSLAITADVGASPGTVTGTSLSVSPTVNTVYALTATNATGSVVKTLTVTVTAAIPPPVIASFTATPSSITNGSPSTLAWSVSGASSLSISADIGAGPGAVTGTSVSVSPSANTVYTLRATNAGGTVTKTAAISVTNPVQPPVIGSFTAAPASIAVGGNSTLSWSVTGATSLSIASNVGASPGPVTGTSIVVSPTANSTYTLTATNAGGSVTKSVPVTVNSPLPVVHSFGSIPGTLNAGESATLFWDVSGAVSISIAASSGPSLGLVTGNSMIITPAATLLYTLTATNATGGVTHSVAQVTVNAAPPLPVPVINSFEASPDEISLGASTNLTWSITGADAISIAADHGASPGVVTGTSVSVSPTVDTVYTITATNTFGNAMKSTDVTVHGPSAPTIGSFGASPAFIQVGSPSTLNWSVSGADTISIVADVGPSPGVVTGTSLIVSPTVTTNYTLTATNTIGSNTAIAPVTIFTPGTGSVVHPRIWITPASAVTLNARATANDPAWLKLRADCDAYVNMTIKFPDQDGTDNSISGGYEYNDYLKPSEELALGYVAAKTADPVRAARYAAKERQLLLALSDPVRHGRPTTDSGYSIRSYVPALALGYDWIFETLGDADRVQIYTEINRWVASYEDVGFGRDYPQGNYFAGYYAAKPLGALATEGENPQGPAMWNDWLNRVHYGMVQPYYSAWLSGGGAPDGWNYGPFETINMIRPMAAAFTAKGLDLIHDAKPMAYHDGHARWMTQFTWPDMKTVSDRGFVYNSDNPTGTDAAWATQFNGLLRLANGSNAAIMQRYTLDLRAQQGTGDVEAWAEFLLHSNSAPAADYRTALSYKTNGDGQVAMRSSWASDAVWGAFQAGPYTGYPGSSEEFFDEGALTIQRGNVQFLINTWGAMMRHTPGTNDGDPVFDDVYNELFNDQTDGVHAGRRIFNTYYAVRPDGYWGQVESTPFDHSTTTLSRFEEGGGYVLMRGTHLENQYFEDHPISGWTRTVAYVRPQLFIAYDRTTIKNAATDNWMAWHVGPKPVARTDAATGTRAFDVTDTRAAFGGNLFRGRVTTVFPAGNLVSNVDVFGRGKVYRLEVRSASPVAANTWLTVFDASATAGAAKNAAPLTATVGSTVVAEGTLISGGTGNNVAVLFSKNGNAIAGTLGTVIPAADTFVLVNDLAANAGYAITATLANGSLTLQFAPGGTFTTTASGTLPLNVSAAGAVTAP